jgi:hypothetical protein
MGLCFDYFLKASFLTFLVEYLVFVVYTNCNGIFTGFNILRTTGRNLVKNMGNGVMYG